MREPASTTVMCELCPRQCVLGPGERGDCRIRANLDGRLVALTWGAPCAIHLDPIEKKPLFHFLPGTPILSIATAGCNLHCKNCQNWEISQANPEDLDVVPLPPAGVVELALRERSPSIAYTYTEPVVWYEYTLDTARLARERGLRNVLVTAGYLREPPLRELAAVTDAANIDLKFMDDRLYREICDGELTPILRAIELFAALGVWVEITNLVIPTLNDRDEDLRAVARWVRQTLGPDTPLHYSAFYPQYRLRHLPPTPPETLRRARDIGRAEGLRYVYVGNVHVPEGEVTRCPACGAAVVRRVRYTVLENRVVGGACGVCAESIAGVWR
ncbi:MAG: AmmeMemoRadiSam system radical SAM enzyme [Kiritimatiellae bacterium]|nr:AmmeMemoRadiSam system radical SAM enzyme [Kiritimatiellia bacterium]